MGQALAGYERARGVAPADGFGSQHFGTWLEPIGHLPELDRMLWTAHVARAAEPLALIGGAGLVVRTTRSFDRLVAEGDTLQIRQRTLGTVDATAHAALEAAIGSTMRREGPGCAAVRCPRANGRAALILTVQSLGGMSQAVIVAAIDPARRPDGAVMLWRQAFGLTQAEAELAMLLMAGHSIESACAMRNCQPPTLKVHLRHLFAKTGVNRQTDLIALLARVR